LLKGYRLFTNPDKKEITLEEVIGENPFKKKEQTKIKIENNNDKKIIEEWKENAQKRGLKTGD